MKTGKAEGFTLLEVAVAVAITAGMLLAVIETVNYHLSVIENQRAKAVARMLCREKLSALKSSPGQSSGRFAPPYSDYEFRSDTSDSPLPGYGMLTVTVRKGAEEAELKAFFRR